MDSINPYALPQSSLRHQPAASESMWRDGKVLVLRTGSQFPDRCIKCNHPTVAPTRRYKLAWHPPSWYLLILLNILIYAIVGAAVSKRTVVHVGLCKDHQRRVLIGRIIGWGGLGIMGLLLALAAILESAVPVGICGLLFLPWALAAIIVNRLVTPVRIDKDFTKLKGCGEDFLDSLPVHTGT